MPIASFIDDTWQWILLGYAGLLILALLVKPRRLRDRPLGIWLVVGLLILGLLLALADWLIDEVF